LTAKSILYFINRHLNARLPPNHLLLKQEKEVLNL
jgi:hypothetical protein